LKVWGEGLGELPCRTRRGKNLGKRLNEKRVYQEIRKKARGMRREKNRVCRFLMAYKGSIKVEGGNGKMGISAFVKCTMSSKAKTRSGEFPKTKTQKGERGGEQNSPAAGKK